MKLYGNTVRINKKEWEHYFINHYYGLRDSTTTESICEVTKGKIKYDALGFGKVEDNVFIDMELLRIGKSKQEGETIIATRRNTF